MAQQIGFNELFNKASFDQGVSELVKVIGKITEEIELAELAGRMLSETLGRKVKEEIKSLSAASKTLTKDIADITAKMDAFKATNIKLTETTKAYEKEVNRLKNELEKLKTEQQKVNTEVEKGTKAKGNLAKMSNALAQSFIGVASGAAIIQRGIQVLTEQLRLAVESTIAFEKVMKEVQAVSGATGDELKLLTANANKLGATTEKTAQQVAEAQKELAKLGFSTPEILLATKAIVDLSTATQEDLVKSAEVSAATLRSFGLDVSELQRVTDVMTKSFIISALDLEKFRESMKLVAPIAANTGVEIETITAALAKLSDTGISGSLSGTALRNLLSSLADPTEKLVKFIGQYDETLKDGIQSSEDFTRALKVLKESNIDLETAVSMVDVRARSAFFTLVNYADDVEYLALELKYLDNETEEVAKTMRDSLANDIDIANSSFDSLRRNLIEGYIPAMREAVQASTTLSEAMRLFNAGVIYHDSTIVKLLKTYFEWLKMVHPLSVSLKVATTALGLFGVEFSSLEEDVEKGKAAETFENMSTNVGKMIEEFGKVDSAVRANKSATEILNGTSKDAEAGLIALRMSFTKLAHVTDDQDFLKLVIGQTEKQIKTAYGFITALEAEEKTLQSLIDGLKEEAKKKELSEAQTTILKNAEVALMNVRNLRFAQDEKLIQLMGTMNIQTEEEIQKLLEKAEVQSKLVKLQNDLRQIYAKIAEEQAKYNLDEAESNEIKLILLEDYKQARLNTQKVILNGELESIRRSEESEEEKNVRIQIAYAKHKQTLLNIDREYLKQKEAINEKELSDFGKTLSEEVKKDGAQKTAFKKSENEMLNFFKDKANEQFDIFINGLNAQSDADWDDEQKRIKAEAEKRQQRIEAAQQLAQGLSDITRSIFDNQQLARENEMNAIDAWEQERIRMAGDNEEAIAAIEKEAEERRKKVRIEQAKADKKEAIFQILIRTAVGIMNALTSFPPNPILAAVIGATGALQAATVAARPLPQFEKGTNYSPEGRAIVGEAGSELIIDGRTKQARLSPDRASITHLSKGSQVIPAHITQKLLTDPNFDYNGVAEKYLNKSTVIKVEQEKNDFDMLAKRVEQAITNIPINQTNFDERGVTNYVVKRNVRLRRLNKRY